MRVESMPSTTPSETRDFSVALPVPVRLSLRNFSLYQRRRTVDASFDKNVFCLAGANGLGKSTFLAAMNFAITGTVIKPGLNFLGAGKLYEDSLSYSRTFFEGRIDADDHDIAEVEIELEVNGYVFKLTRGMFAPQGLRELQWTTPLGESKNFNSPGVTDEERHGRYSAAIVEATGLSSFAQLVFLQWMVLTFDEQRNLIFWSDRVAEQALFLAFGISSEAAEQAEALQRAIDSADSKARNLQWQATGVRKRLDVLNSVSADSPTHEDADDDLGKTHEDLIEKLDVLGQEHETALAKLKDYQVQLDQAASAQASTSRAYEVAFQQRVKSSSAAHFHPDVLSGLEDICPICHATGPHVGQNIRQSLEQHQCPLCSSEISADAKPDAEAERKLRELGEALVEEQDRMSSLQLALARQIGAVDERDRALRETRDRLDEFRTLNTRALAHSPGDSAVDDAKSGLRREIADLLRQKDDQTERRDQARSQLDQLRTDLSGRFAEMEGEFVPLLQNLAFEFLGIPLNVDLNRRGGHLGLSLQFQGSQRATPDALSESQRFFMDIALRMALARKMSSAANPATLYIDTPEGSLDIAYEGRAGRMFGLFAEGEDRIIMTANINTSDLLQELALNCGTAGMNLVRMTDWADLSEVQQEAHEQFETAFAGIEANLERGKQ